MKRYRNWSVARKTFRWVGAPILIGGIISIAFILLSPPEWPLFGIRYRTLRLMRMNGFEVSQHAGECRHPRYVDAIAHDIAGGSAAEALLAFDMVHTMFMRQGFMEDSEIVARLEPPVLLRLERETNSIVRCSALGVLYRSCKLASRAQEQVVKSLDSSDLREATAAARVAVHCLQQEVLARALIERLLDSNRDEEIQAGLTLLGGMPDLSAYMARIERLQTSNNPALRRHKFEMRRRLELEEKWRRKTNSGVGVDLLAPTKKGGNGV